MNDKLTMVKNAITSKAAISVLKTQKHSPAIMFGAGVVGMIGTVVLASKATLDLEEVLDNHDKVNHDLEGALGKPLRNGGVYDEDNLKSDKLKMLVKTGITIGKLYGPALACGVVSIGLLTGAHVTLSKRNAGLVAAYTTVTKAMNDYRARVVDDQGEQKDLEYMYGVSEKEVYSEGKKGEPIVTRQKVFAGASQYARLFNRDNCRSLWNEDPSTSLFAIRCVERWANERLQSKGHVFLNEVYDEFGFDRTPAGQIVGWVKNNPTGRGDGLISFGVQDEENGMRLLDFLTGHEGELLLEFNVDGPVHELI